MRFRTVIAAAVVTLALGAAAAQATPGFATANVNIRTGPDIVFPSVGVIPEGEPLGIEGCLRDEVLVRRPLGGRSRLGLQRVPRL